jgi:L-seryl-tRNA(Ser) seleniumtransferase
MWAMASEPNPLSQLPRIDDLVDAAADLVARHGRGPVTEALRTAVDNARARLLDNGGEPPEPAALTAEAADLLRERRPGPPRRVINATGVVLHTNLGRAPLGAAAVEAAVEAAGYCDLEYDLDSGARGSRGARLEPLLVDATGAEAGFAVNNAAAALVLALAALALGKPVAVSRGELIEIGGSFRLPDIMAASGARLVEVGTTNRTRAADYRIDGAGALLKVHPSNYRIEGFAEAPSVAELAEVARSLGVPLVHDVGSGLLHDRDERWLDGEPSVAASLAAGADLVICSGDKLLGGPQAGLLVGRADLVAACRRHPLARALRLDKLRIAALVATLEAHLRGDLAAIPAWAMLGADPAALGSRAERLAAAVGGTTAEGTSLVGGGSAPGLAIPSPVVRVPCAHPDDVAATLRAGEPPIIVRVEDDAVWLDPRTVTPSDDEVLASSVRAALEPP